MTLIPSERIVDPSQLSVAMIDCPDNVNAATMTTINNQTSQEEENLTTIASSYLLNLRSHSNIGKLAETIGTLPPPSFIQEQELQQQQSPQQQPGKHNIISPTTEQLIIVCPGCEPDWSTPEVQSLFEAIGSGLEQLQTLKLNCVGLLDVAFPLRLLTILLQACPRLQVLDMDDVAVSVSSVDEVSELVHAIEQRQQSTTNSSTNTKLPPLTKFRLFGCLANDTLESLLQQQQQQSDNPISLDPLWASLSTLESVELDAVDDGLLGSISATSMQQLTSSRTIQTLHLNGYVLENDSLDVMAASLTTNTTLTDLSFDLYSLGHPGHEAFALAEALRCNQHIETLHLTISHAWNDDTFLQALATGLATDCTLKALTIGTCAKITDTTAQAFADMTVSNYALEKLQISTYHGSWKSVYLHYTGLNRKGRGFFHSNFGSLSRKEWVDKGLVPFAEDINVLFYYLQMNPMLCCPPSTTAAAAARKIKNT